MLWSWDQSFETRGVHSITFSQCLGVGIKTWGDKVSFLTERPCWQDLGLGLEIFEKVLTSTLLMESHLGMPRLAVNILNLNCKSTAECSPGLPVLCQLVYLIYISTIRDAILTCARKLTWVSLIYCAETTTKKCKTEKVKSKNGYVQK